MTRLHPRSNVVKLRLSAPNNEGLLTRNRPVRVYNGATINEHAADGIRPLLNSKSRPFNRIFMEGSHALQRGLEWADSSCMPRLVCITMAHGPSSNVHAPIFGSYHGPSVSFASFSDSFSRTNFSLPHSFARGKFNSVARSIRKYNFQIESLLITRN